MGWRCVFQVVDIVVKPSYQGNALGKNYAENSLSNKSNLSWFLCSLINDDPANKIYEQFGFTNTYPKSHGMKLSSYSNYFFL
ncbi:GNAT family protein [Salipaludibacillus neizhouensis]|uniref:GNAT family N-acetyltransferase n=1 Tax=Salipaludibacillus neizhouensis TaxID=885475 RepID=UPI0011C393B9|nr:GNAT family N-acetyltransferase [Salipaludibacillus neizhouensis]